MRTDRSRRRILHQAQALSQCGLLHRPDLPVDGIPDLDVPGALCDSADIRLDRPVARDAARPGTEDCPAAPNLSGPRHAPVCPHGPAELTATSNPKPNGPSRKTMCNITI